MSVMNTRKLFCALFLLSLLTIPFLSVPPARADDTIGVVDQSNVVSIGFLHSIQYFSPIGQSFTPMLAGLDVVELWTEDSTLDNGFGVEIYVNIREANIYGPILGTSYLLQLEDSFQGVTRFIFPSLVSLTPGKLYVIEVIAVGGEAWIVYYNWGIGSSGGPYSTYPGGTWILNGEEVPENDLWFREGLANPTPQSSAYCKNGLWAYLTRANSTFFKNQGDCLQYVNTGK
jgi:hypothetical protein